MREFDARRRGLLAAAATSAAALVLHVRAVHAAPEDMAAALKETFGDRPLKPGRVQLEIPQIAENGNVVPVTITAQSPMTAQDHVAAIYLFAEKNPLPRMVEFTLGPQCGKARVATRVRVATTQKILAVAAFSDGSLGSHAVEIEVTTAACGG